MRAIATQSPRAHLAGSGHQAGPYCKTTFEPHPRVLSAMQKTVDWSEDPGHEVGSGFLNPRPKRCLPSADFFYP